MEFVWIKFVLKFDSIWSIKLVFNWSHIEIWQFECDLYYMLNCLSYTEKVIEFDASSIVNQIT